MESAVLLPLPRSATAAHTATPISQTVFAFPCHRSYPRVNTLFSFDESKAILWERLARAQSVTALNDGYLEGQANE
jgi:hypothetical protein